jgi:hypothetical protein
MSHRSLAGVAAVSIFLVSLAGPIPVRAQDDIVIEGSSTPPPPPDPNAANRLLDIEAAIGAIIGAESDPPVDDNLLYGGSVAVRLIDRLDGELGFWVGDTKVRSREDETTDEHQEVKYLYGLLRYYPYFAVNGYARPYIFFGPTQFWDLEHSDTDTGLMSGAGIRFQPGERFGFTVKFPVVVAVTGGDANTMLLPTFNLFWQFNLGGGGAPSSS